ncbi:MAG: flagellin [Lachnospiraceae bacterium]|nr:flagellin [Lachnospiraceae bacterium]
MYISFNASAVIANNSLNRADNRLKDSLAKLSSGLKVVNPKDNPSGLAMAKRMNAQIRGLEQANLNSNDAVSIIEIADGTMSELSEMLQRMNELSVKAATGTMTEDDREMVDKELQQLKKEVTRISTETSFNSQPILDGSFDLRGYTDNVNVKVAYYSDDVKFGSYAIDTLEVEFKEDGTIDTTKANPVVATISGTNAPMDAKVTAYDGNTITIRNDKGFEIKLEVYKSITGPGKETFKSEITGTAINMTLTGFGALDMQIGANEGQQLAIRIPKMSLENMGISNIKLTPDYDASGNVTKSGQEYAEEAIVKIKDAMKYVSSARANLGAYQNRLEHTISSLDITSENMTGAYSRIMDADMAEEMTEYTTVQVLTQASTSMVAQANERPSQVLQLLQ